MNELLLQYATEVEYPDVSGAEHLQLLALRDRLAEMETTFSATEQAELLAADQRLVEQAAAFYAELRRFVDLGEYRQQHRVAPARWWWYLDVLSEVPLASSRPGSKLPSPNLAE